MQAASTKAAARVAGSASMLQHRPARLCANRHASATSPASIRCCKSRSSIGASSRKYSTIQQSRCSGGERFLHTEEVVGSNPTSPTSTYSPVTCHRAGGGFLQENRLSWSSAVHRQAPLRSPTRDTRGTCRCRHGSAYATS